MNGNPRLPSSLLHSEYKLAYLFQISFNSEHGGRKFYISNLYKTLKVIFSESY